MYKSVPPQKNSQITIQQIITVPSLEGVGQAGEEGAESTLGGLRGQVINVATSGQTGLEDMRTSRPLCHSLLPSSLSMEFLIFHADKFIKN